MGAGMEGRVAIVTGAAGALGTAVVERFAELGATVAQLDVLAIDNAHYADVCNLTDGSDCLRAVAAISDALGAVDVLANIAGGFAMGESVHETTDETWRFLMGLNAESVLNMARAAVPHMLGRAASRGHGKIINVGAGPGQKGVGLMGAYAASKSVVIRLTETMAEELKEQSINVNCVLPSIIDTPRNRADMPDADYASWVTPAAMARVVSFLASSDADPIHGAALPVAGLS